MTAIRVGAVTITATSLSGEVKASCLVTVKSRFIDVASISLSCAEIDIVAGELYRLEATIEPSNATNQSVAWSSSNAAVASVNSGVVSANMAGEATITVTSLAGGLSASCHVTVYPKSKLLEPLMNEILSYMDPNDRAHSYVDETRNPTNFSGPIVLYNYPGPRYAYGYTSIPNSFYLVDATSDFFKAEVTPRVTIAPTSADSLKVFNSIVDFFQKVADINTDAVPYLRFTITTDGGVAFIIERLRADKLQYYGLQTRKTIGYLDAKGLMRAAVYDNKGVTQMNLDIADVVNYYDAFSNVIDIFLHFVGRGNLNPYLYTIEDEQYSINKL